MDRGRITLYIAASVDGFIADEDGGVEWLEEFSRKTEADGDAEGYDEFFSGIDCLVMGARTYEQIREFGEWPYGDRPTYVFTNRALPRLAETVEFVEGDVGAVATQLKRRYGHVWLVGGAQLLSSFLSENEVDELRLSLVPILLGSGIRLFPAGGARRRLRQLESITHGTGIAELRYDVVN